MPVGGIRAAARTPVGGTRTTARALAVAVVAAAAFALAACSGGEDTNGLEDASPAEVGTRTVEALRAAGSVHVVGSVRDPASEVETTYDLVMSGSATRGTVESGPVSTEVIKIADDTFVRAGSAYYESIGEGDAAELLADRWVRLSLDAAGQYSYFTIDGFARSIAEYVAALEGGVSTEDVSGRRAVAVGSTEGTRLWAANTGEAVPLRLDTFGQNQGRMEFSDYGAEVAISAPADAVDLSQLD